MKTEMDTENPTTAPASSDGGGGVTSTKTTKSSRFLWDACSNESQPDRICIKRHAVLDGLRLGRRVSIELRKQTEGENQGLGTEDLADWAEQFDEVKKQYETPNTTVGLFGGIGSGKSTLLNAILGERNLLPPSHDRAGTAVACRTRYNHDSDGYRARVVFRSRQSFTEELDKLFENLHTTRELRKRMEEEEYAHEKEAIEDELSELEGSRTETLGILKVLFEVNQGDLESMSAKEFLKLHPLEVLGQIKEIEEADGEKMAAKIRPYLDSTPLNQDGKDVMLWPLVVEVTLYVPSDFLKYGMEFVDLPGPNDESECRSSVAERFSKHLDITVIVAPAIRATAEKTVIGFFRKREENDMRMDGKLNPNSLCVVLSKSEDVVPYEYLKEKWIAKDYPSIKQHLDRAQILDRIVRTAESGHGESEPKPLGLSTSTSTSTRQDSDVEINRRDFSTLTESLKQAAVSIRNRSVSERIQQGFRTRQVGSDSPKHGKLVNDTVEVFPTSARAFQAIRHPGPMKEVGFPDERHTGIPHLKQWLDRATFKNQEEHFDGILRGLKALFVRIENWIIATENPGRILTQGLGEIEIIHEQHCRSLTSSLSQSGDKLRQIEPLKAKEAALAKCQSEYPKKMDRWRFRYPNDPTSMLKIHEKVQGAILRNSGTFVSRGNNAGNYEWIDDLNTIFIDGILDPWDHTFQIVVPGLKTKIERPLEPVWSEYSAALLKFCTEHNVLQLRLSENVPMSEKVEQAIDGAQGNLAHNVLKVLRRLQKGAQTIHPIFRKGILEILEPAFKEASVIKGLGCVAERNEILKQFAREHAVDMPVKVCEAMEVELASLIDRHARELVGLAEKAISEVRKQMKDLLGIDKTPVSPAARIAQQHFTKEIKPHLRSWELCWKKPLSQCEDPVMGRDLSIPDPKLLILKVEGGA